MTAEIMHYGKITGDRSGLLHYKADNDVNILNAATEAVEEYGRQDGPMWFWHGGTFCPLDRFNDAPIELVRVHDEWKNELDSDPKSILKLLGPPQLSIGFQQDRCGIWHYKNGSRSLEQAATETLDACLNPYETTFFWFRGFVCPVWESDTPNKLAARWTDWQRGYGNHADSLRQFFDTLV